MPHFPCSGVVTNHGRSMEHEHNPYVVEFNKIAIAENDFDVAAADFEFGGLDSVTCAEDGSGRRCQEKNWKGGAHTINAI